MSLAKLLRDGLETHWEFPGGSGNGIIIVGGGKYLASAYVAIRHLRSHGSQLPIQLWHLGQSELPDFWRELTAELDVAPVDAFSATGANEFHRLGGWECKIHALTACRFSRVLFIDADNIPLSDPSYLLLTPEFSRHGQVFWPDFVYRRGQRYAMRVEAIKELGLSLTNGLELESGQLAIDRERCWRELQICRLLNVHSHECYGRWTWGDKDTLTLAWLLTKRPYTVVTRRPKYIDPPQRVVFWQHWFDGRKLFQHQRKWFEPPGQMPGRLLEGEIFKEESLQYLRDFWQAANESGSAGTLYPTVPRKNIPLTARTPVNADEWHRTGAQAYQAGDFEYAVRCLKEATAKAPTMISYRTDLAAAHLKARRPAEALPQLLFALSRGAASPELHNNLGAALRDLGRFKEAASAFRNAVTMRPGYLQAQQNLAEALRLSGDLEGAIAALRSLAARAPQSVAVHQELNDIGDESGDLELKLWSLRRLLELQPHAANVHSALLYNLHYDPLMTPAALFEEHLKWHRAFGEVTSYTQLRHNFSNGRRIRVGYVSPDFRHHTVPRFIGAALKHHDRGRFEVFCYSDVAKDDGMTELLRSYVEHWRDVVGLPNDRAEQIIREDGIDILVDLRGHAAGNRLRLFARKPAPIQINMVGYFDTTGLSAIDYRLTDVNQDPVGVSEKYHCEQLIRMPGTCWCYTADEDAPDIAPPPCERKGFIMLGSLNKLIKISEPCAKLWLRTLDAIPHSRLLLHVPSDRSANAIRQRLEKFGLPAARLELTAKAASRRAYLERFNEIDIALDTFPFNGITTTCDALYMAVPVVSLSGGTTVSRAGASILHGVGLPYLATATEQEFIDTAVSIAGDRIALVELRRGLRDRMRNSPLMNHIGFTRSLETQYERMCRQLQEEA